MTREDQTMSNRTFAEIYGEREGLPPEVLHTALFFRTLYPHARLIAWFVRWCHPPYFIADYEFVEDVGHLRSLEDFSLTLGSYIEHPSNRGFLRRRLRIRISARRMFRVVRSVFAPGGPGAVTGPVGRDTFEPFDRTPRAPRPQ
jgi:hypothetical protein